MPVVVGATAVAQGEQREKLAGLNSQEKPAPRRETMALSPRRITQLGVAAVAGLLVASVFYHTHLPG
jgi:hypothetical protein